MKELIFMKIIKLRSYKYEFENKDLNRCLLNANNRYIGKFVSDNVVNLLSGRNLSKVEISLLSKGLKFVPTFTMLIKLDLGRS